jgi:hypothetical protein
MPTVNNLSVSLTITNAIYVDVMFSPKAQSSPRL